MKTEGVKEIDSRNTYSLILYTGPWPGSIGSVAFLDREDDRITLEPYAPGFAFKVIKGLQAEEALTRAESFISGHSSFRRSRLARIVDDYDRVIGYEIRPLYLQTTFGSEDILDISYRQSDNRVDIHVRLDPHVEQLL